MIYFTFVNNVSFRHSLESIEPAIAMNLQFYLRFHTEFGQSLWISGNTEELGMNDPEKAVAMAYLNDEFWHIAITIPKKSWPGNGISYRYFLKNKDGELTAEWVQDREITMPGKSTSEVQLIDTWNHAGEYENAFFTAPFKNVLLKQDHGKAKSKKNKQHTHVFKVKAPLLNKHEVIGLSGSNVQLGNWSKDN